ncbi:phosphogluconate dehydrogenase (NAD(+)-dependent, decarboxylating) [Pararobbsia alpina]|uniref:6-phosphogluconate dehydrogenase, NAD(+)-dependent, decarboxylating n=1 Tax=Pararobbsia alpina TaxID=621374 RepID=A0A6S7B8J1_9BURK|nr:decarboxylating 6-phosphogluconate dehydrogenase [Pararobbsia alpina]CAB3791483.1 6-phosphogluconate dehydrogenase, NAD(+)-dependent, decarboxylating [Pararobbsia alpina]
MQIGIVGLGRMGANIARRLIRGKHEVVVWNRSSGPAEEVGKEGASVAKDFDDVIAKLKAPRVVWIMLPAGQVTEEAVKEFAGKLSPGDIIIDGGNTHYKDDVRRAKEIEPKQLHYVDVGTSGGVWGLQRGYCMMIGGPDAIVKHLDPVFDTLAPGLGDIPRTPNRGNRDSRAERGYIHAGPAGAGHFVKMVHNGIEYGLMQAYAEGFDILKGKNSEELPQAQRYNLDMADIAEVWRRGSVVSSWLLDLSAAGLAQHPTLENYAGEVSDSGEGRWTIEAAIEEAVPANVLSASLYARFRSRKEHTFGERLLSAMRFGFGGHVEPK